MATLVEVCNVNPSGSSGSIAASLTGGAANGDFVVIFFAWDTSDATHSLATCSDPTGQSWTVVTFTGGSLTGIAGGYAWCIVGGGGWSTTNTATGALNTGAPGGRCALGFKIPAGTLTATPVDPATVLTPQKSASPVATPGTLATSDTLEVAFDLTKQTSSPAALTWGAGWTPDDSVTGSGVPSCGIFVAEQTVTTTTPAAATGTSATSTDQHAIGVLCLELAGTTPVTGSAAISSASSMIAAGIAKVIATAAAVSASSIVAAGVTRVLGSAAVSSASSIVAAGVTRVLGHASLSSSSSMVASGVTRVPGSAHLGGSSSVVAAGVAKVIGAAAISSSSNITAAGSGAHRLVLPTLHVEPGSHRLADVGEVRA